MQHLLSRVINIISLCEGHGGQELTYKTGGLCPTWATYGLLIQLIWASVICLVEQEVADMQLISQNRHQRQLQLHLEVHDNIGAQGEQHPVAASTCTMVKQPACQRFRLTKKSLNVKFIHFCLEQMRRRPCFVLPAR